MNRIDRLQDIEYLIYAHTTLANAYESLNRVITLDGQYDIEYIMFDIKRAQSDINNILKSLGGA